MSDNDHDLLVVEIAHLRDRIAELEAEVARINKIAARFDGWTLLLDVDSIWDLDEQDLVDTHDAMLRALAEIRGRPFVPEAQRDE